MPIFHAKLLVESLICLQLYRTLRVEWLYDEAVESSSQVLYHFVELL